MRYLCRESGGSKYVAPISSTREKSFRGKQAEDISLLKKIITTAGSKSKLKSTNTRISGGRKEMT